MLKDSDPRLSKTLTLAEFCVAFGVYRDCVCEVYPQRREELDSYMAIIADLARSYGGSLFYEYHKSFSAKAALHIQKFNQRLDWSVVDLSLISRHFTGHRMLGCPVCGSFNHSANLCPKTVFKHESPQQPQPNAISTNFEGQPKKQVRYMPGNRNPICNKFNESVCTFPNCIFMHVCSWCGDSHPRSVCPRRVRTKSAKY